MDPLALIVDVSERANGTQHVLGGGSQGVGILYDIPESMTQVLVAPTEKP